MESYIVLNGVSKSFRSVEVLKPLSIEFEEGLIHGIVGQKWIRQDSYDEADFRLSKANTGYSDCREKNVWERM